jgi:hypothetical protein
MLEDLIRKQFDKFMVSRERSLNACLMLWMPMSVSEMHPCRLRSVKVSGDCESRLSRTSLVRQ